MKPRPPKRVPDADFIDRLTKGTMILLVALMGLLVAGLIIIFLQWLASLV